MAGAEFFLCHFQVEHLFAREEKKFFSCGLVQALLHGDVLLGCARVKKAWLVHFLDRLENSVHSEWLEGHCTIVKVDFVTVPLLVSQTIFLYLLIFVLISHDELLVKHAAH